VLTLPAAAQARVVGPRFGGIAILPAPVFGGFWYNPYYWGPYGGYYYVPAVGAVKFDTGVKDAQVFVNGAYAGTVGKLKTLHIRPGSYNIELRAPDGERYAEKIYVVAGKTLHLHPDLRIQAQS
jgi:hypothetical protein